MKEFVEKLIGRFEELGWVFADYYPDETSINRKRKKSVAYDDVIGIVNKLSEEYKGKLVSADEVGYMLDCIEMRCDETWMDYYHKALEGLCELRGKDTNVTTNADRIRNMSDEELADFLEEFEACDVCKYLDNNRCTFENPCVHEFAGAMIYDWLQSEVKGSDV